MITPLFFQRTHRVMLWVLLVSSGVYIQGPSAYAGQMPASVPLVDSAQQAKPTRNVAVTIRVVDAETSAWVPGTQLSVTDDKTQQKLTLVFDSVGKGFGVPASPGTSWTIRASAPGYLVTKAQLTNLIYSRQITITLVKPKPSLLTIKVFATNIQQPLASATAVITSRTTGKSERLALPGGRLEQAYTSPDELDIVVSAAGYTSLTRRMAIEVLPSGKRYELDAELDPIESLKPPVTAPMALAKSVSLKPLNPSPVASVSVITTKPFGVIEKGKTIRLNKLYFDQSSPVLRPDSYTELDQLYDVLVQNPSLRIEIRGHTDNQGDFDLNIQLSRDRCQAVVDYLVSKGIQKSRLKAVGRGSLDPVAPNNSEENRKKNRRVEFVII